MTDEATGGHTVATMRLQFRPDAMHPDSLEMVPADVPLVDAGTNTCNSAEAAQATVDLLQSDGIAPCVVVMDDGACHAGVFYDPTVFSDDDADLALWNVWEIHSIH